MAKKRFSIYTKDMKSCYVCGACGNIEIHEVFFGALRNKSIQYGLCVPLCPECHKGTYGVHGSRGKMMNISLKEEGQRLFMDKYPELEFIKIFGRNWI